MLIHAQVPNLCKTAGEVAGRRWVCLQANGTLMMGTCGTAPLPRRAALLAIPGAMDPKRV